LLLEEKYQKEQYCTKSDTSLEHDVIQSFIIVNDNITKNYKHFENSTTVDDDFSIVVENATAKWTDNQKSNSLEKINLTIRPGRLLAVIGSVGSGKVKIQNIINYLNYLKNYILQ